MRRHDFGYFFHEGISNMFSHGFMSFAAIGITVACLLIMGTFTLVAVNADAQLKDLETKIAYARQFYNDVVLKYNTKIETVPSNIIAGMFHFEQEQYFQADEGSRQVPQVRF